MPRADFPEEHMVVLDYYQPTGKHVFHDLKVEIPRVTVEAAEAGDEDKQQEVIDAFVTRFKRRFLGIPYPEELVWDDFRHPIEPTVQGRP